MCPPHGCLSVLMQYLIWGPERTAVIVSFPLEDSLWKFRHLNRLAVQQGDTLTLQSILHVTCARISLVSIQAQCHPCACYGNGTTLTLSIWQWFLQGFFFFFFLKSNYAPPPNKTSPFGQIARWTASISIQNLHPQPFCIPLRASSAEMYSLESSCSGRRAFYRFFLSHPKKKAPAFLIHLIL